MLLAALVACGCARAAPQAEQAVIHVIQPGDTLTALAQRYLEDPQDWRSLADANGIARPRRLVPGSSLRIPMSLLRWGRTVASVDYVRGTATLRCAAPCTSHALQAGDTLAEGQAVEVGPRAFVTLKLTDGSVLHLDADSRLELQRAREQPGTGSRRVEFMVRRGRVDTAVQPQPSGSQFRIHTPITVTGVRGTEFGVAASGDGRHATTDVAGGTVAVQAGREAQAVDVPSGRGSVVAKGGAGVKLVDLLPAPDLSRTATWQGDADVRADFAPLAGAVAYRVSVAAVGRPDAVLGRIDVASPPAQLGAMEPGRYLVQARARDADGLLGREASVEVLVTRRPVAPLAQEPTQDAVVKAGLVELVCTGVPLALAYRIDVFRGDAPSEPVVSSGPLDACRFTAELKQPGRYHWRATSMDKAPDGSLAAAASSEPSRLRVVQPPAAPEPAVEQPDPNTVRLHWGGPEGAAYAVQLAGDLAFANVVQSIEVAAPAAELKLPSACQTYYVRVRTVDARGWPSAYSAPRVINGQPPVCLSDQLPLQSSDGRPVLRGAP